MHDFFIHLIPTVVVLGMLIFVHEFGHFIACRLARVNVEKFSIGFGPELFAWQGKITRYSLSLIPLGGFVKPQGETSEEIEVRGKPSSRDFLSASAWRRFSILVAGIVMNFLLAYVLLAAVLCMGRPVLAANIGEIIKGYPAGSSGMRVGDRVVALNHVAVSDWPDLLVKMSKSTSSVLFFSVLRDGHSVTIPVVPKFEKGQDVFGVVRMMPKIGILPDPAQIHVERYKVPSALVRAFKLEWNLTRMTYQAIWYLVTGKLSLKALSGPIGIVSLAGSAAKMGMAALLQFTAVLSVSLAVINLLPIPALDGGHLLFLGLEVVTRKQISTRVQERMTQAGFYFLIFLMIMVIYNDLVNVGLVAKIKQAFFLRHQF